jgi:hypothetical protein
MITWIEFNDSAIPTLGHSSDGTLDPLPKGKFYSLSIPVVYEFFIEIKYKLMPIIILLLGTLYYNNLQ